MWALDDIRKLQQKKYRLLSGHFIAEGEHLVQELRRAAVHNPALFESRLFLTSRFESFCEGFEARVLSEAQMSRISDTKTPQGVLAVVPIAAVLEVQPTPATTHACYFYEIQDPGNLGSILRTLAWFGSARCLLSPDSVDPFNPKVVRASMGAIFHVPLELDVTLASLSGRFPRIACLDMNGVPVTDAGFPQQDVYVFGNEARGVPREALETLGARAFSIPGTDAIESLNLASTVSICAYERGRAARQD
ncbi:MAG: RNA methyltransferase [Pseudomonadales bacterium]|nr:RNA methyltransferase [Pseudomonadales bacterium]MCP5356905.1 RNA methyltransferase [Pseudomonadales bacterium]